jgi:hypothetical protein
MAKYKIVRYRFKKRPRTIKKGLTLKEAKAHCNNPKTRGRGWFDGYTKE